MRTTPIRVSRCTSIAERNIRFFIARHYGYDIKSGEQFNLFIGEAKITETGELEFNFPSYGNIYESEINAARQGIMYLASKPFEPGFLTWTESSAGFTPREGKHFLT